MTRPGLLKSQINNRYSVKRTHTPFVLADRRIAFLRPVSEFLQQYIAHNLSGFYAR